MMNNKFKFKPQKRQPAKQQQKRLYLFFDSTRHISLVCLSAAKPYLAVSDEEDDVKRVVRSGKTKVYVKQVSIDADE